MPKKWFFTNLFDPIYQYNFGGICTKSNKFRTRTRDFRLDYTRVFPGVYVKTFEGDGVKSKERLMSLKKQKPRKGLKMYPTIELKFIVRNGEKILQQKFQSYINLHEENEWRDVPCEPEQPLTERQKVCDELLDWIEDDDGYVTCDGLRIKIKQIRDK